MNTFISRVAADFLVQSLGINRQPLVHTFYATEVIDSLIVNRRFKGMACRNDSLHCIHGSPIVEKPRFSEKFELTMFRCKPDAKKKRSASSAWSLGMNVVFRLPIDMVGISK